MRYDIQELQVEGESVSAEKANAEIAKARNATPLHLRHLFRSFIHWHAGLYLYGWILR